MLVHFRAGFRGSSASWNRRSSQLRLWDYLEQTSPTFRWSSWGCTNPPARPTRRWPSSGVAPHTPEWNAAIEETLARQKAGHASAPVSRNASGQIICAFIPWTGAAASTKTGISFPWRSASARCRSTAQVGRRYAGTVKQIITGSIGFDDWEWGVDLFADDPLVFKTPDLRNAIRPSERRVCAVRIVLRRTPEVARGSNQTTWRSIIQVADIKNLGAPPAFPHSASKPPLSEKPRQGVDPKRRKLDVPAAYVHRI